MSFNRREFLKTLTTSTVIVPLTACAAPSGGKSGGSGQKDGHPAESKRHAHTRKVNVAAAWQQE